MVEERKEEKPEEKQDEVKDVSLTPSEEKDLNKLVDDILTDLNKEEPQKSTPTIDETGHEKPKMEKKEELVEPIKSSDILSEMSKAIEESEKKQMQPETPVKIEPTFSHTDTEKDFSIFGKTPEQEILTQEDETIIEIDKIIAIKEAEAQKEAVIPFTVVKISTLQKLKILTAKIIGKTIRVIILFFVFIFSVLKSVCSGIVGGIKTLVTEKELLKDITITFIASVWLIYYFLYNSILGLILFFTFITPVFIQRIIEIKRSAKTH